jgi:hypothetical protein
MIRASVLFACLMVAGLAHASPAKAREALPAETPPLLLLAIGDSLGHGTMDATNNAWATGNAYLHRVFLSLASVESVHFAQPFYDLEENRIQPATVPTNLAVDGADVFSIEGIQYGKRVGSPVDFVSPSLLADRWLPGRLEDDYDKVLYPTNVLARRPMSQVDAAVWLVDEWAPRRGIERALSIIWIGNNDSSTAALGQGGANPSFLPIPLAQIAPAVDPLLFALLFYGAAQGDVSFEPYTVEAIERNLSEVDDFAAQYDAVLTRMIAETGASGVDVDYFLLTLPYYSAVGYLMDSDDIEFYLRKLDPAYSVPPSFGRVNLPDEPLSGDRISLLTFGFMYALLATGYSSDYVNTILEVQGAQKDGLVLSEAEQQIIMARIDDFNGTIHAIAQRSGDSVHLVEIGELLNAGFLGEIPIEVNGRTLSRKWIRGGGLTFDGVHPNLTGQSLIANFVLQALGAVLGSSPPQYDLSAVAAGDPYWDSDGDGFSPGPPWAASGIPELLHLFRDPDDSSAAQQAVLPENVWEIISSVLLEEILGLPGIRAEAQRRGVEAAFR